MIKHPRLHEEHEMVRRVMLRLLERGWCLRSIGEIWGIKRQRVFQYTGCTGRQERGPTEFLGRVMSRLWSEPHRWSLNRMAVLWGLSINRVYYLIQRARRTCHV